MVDAGGSKGLSARRALGVLAAVFAFAFAFAFWRSIVAASADAPGSSDDAQSANANVAFEASDWPFWPVAATYVGSLALLVLCCFVLSVAYPDALPDVGRTLRMRPSGPQLQTNPEADLRVFRAGEEARLNKYYWADTSKSIVHIPIEQAMRNLAAASQKTSPKGTP
jgi:hypothetical protein